MKFKKIHEKEQKRELSRRALMGWLTAAGASLSIPMWKVQEIIEGSHGQSWAAGETNANKSVMLNWGRGSFAHLRNLLPFLAVGEGSNNNAYAFEGQGRRINGSGGNRPYYVSPAGELWVKEGVVGGEPTVIFGGRGETHTEKPVTALTLPNGVLAPAAGSVMQAQLPGLLRAINVSDPTFGTAAGGATPTMLNRASDMVDTFVSASVEAGGILFEQSDAALYEANVKAWANTLRAVDKPTMGLGLSSVKQSANIVGLNIKDLITPSAADYDRYGLNTGRGNDGRVRELIDFLSVTERMLTYGLCSSFNLQFCNDDPHGYFNDLANNMQLSMSFGRALGAFVEFTTTTLDPVATSETIAQNLLFGHVGDTCKSFVQRGGWPDNDQNCQHGIFFSSRLRNGQFGRTTFPNGGSVTWNPNTGEDAPNRTQMQNGPLVATAALYGMGKDQRVVEGLAGGAAPLAMCIVDQVPS